MSLGRMLLIAVAVAGVAAGIFVLSYSLFSSGGTTPGDGRGERTIVETTP